MPELFDVMSYNYAKVSAVDDIGTTFEQVVTLVTPSLPAGIYEMALSFEMSFNDTKDSSAFFRVTGTYADGTEFSSTASPDTPTKNRYYAFPKVWAGGVITLGLEARKDPSVTQFDVNFADVIVKRVG